MFSEDYQLQHDDYFSCKQAGNAKLLLRILFQFDEGLIAIRIAQDNAF